MWIYVLILVSWAVSAEDTDGESSRKILGSSVVTSVSVIMNTGNETKAVYTDAVGKPMSKPSSASELASPINLLNPDRYEFYTFDDNGDLVKRLMSLDEIQGIIATGDGDGFNFDGFTSEGYMPEKRVNDIVSNVQNVLKEEMELHKEPLDTKPLFDTPDVSDSWSMILPAIFGNSGEDIKPEKPITHVTPDTIMIEPNMVTSSSKKPVIYSSTARSTVGSLKSTTPSPMLSSSSQAAVFTTPTQISTADKLVTMRPFVSSTTTPTTTLGVNNMINVEVYSNSKSTTEKAKDQIGSASDKIVEIKPNFNLTKEQTRPIYHVLSSKKTTRKPTSTTTKVPPTQTQRTSTPPVHSNTKVTAFTHVPILTKATIASLVSSLTSRPTVNTTPLVTTVTEKQNQLPTLAEILNKPLTMNPIRATTTSASVAEVKPETTTEGSSEGITTFTIVGDGKDRFETTTSLENESHSTEQTVKDDLSTLSSEYVTFNNYNEPTTLNEQTTEESLLTMKEKNPTKELLEQLLLTSTNIYEINTELSKKPQEPTTTIREDQRFETTTLQDVKTTPTEEQAAATVDSFYIKLQDLAADTTTTSGNLLESIELLLSQAVNNVEETIVNVNDTLKIQQMLNTTNKNMSAIQMETATIASSLLEASPEITTTERYQIADISSDESNLLNEAVGSLLSQVYGTDAPSMTSIEPFSPTTERQKIAKTTAVSNRKADDEAKEEATSILPEITDRYTEIDLPDEPVKEELKNLTTTTEYLPHLINITIIKPEDLKNSTDAKQNSTGPLFVTPLESNLRPLTTSTEEATTTNEATEATSTERFVIITTESDVSTTDRLSEPTTVLSESTTNDKEITTDFPTTIVDDSIIKLLTTTTETVSETTVPPPTVNPIVEVTITENNASSIMKRNTTSTLESISKPQNTWTLVPTVAPYNDTTLTENPTSSHPINTIIKPPTPVDLVPKPLQGFGLEDSTSQLDTDIYQFAQLCNELAFGFWKSVTSTISSARSVVLSPFSATSLLAMVFLGARGATSGEMNEILKLDDMVTFNPHLIFKNITESIKPEDPDSGIAISTIIRQLYSDRSKGKLLGFYKERVRQFYDGHVEEASFREIGDVIRRRTNLLVKKYTSGKVLEYLKDSTIKARAPLAGVGVNIFQTNCSQASTEGRDGELHFVVLPSIRQRRLIPIPAVVWRSGFLAGYEPSLDATAVALGTKDQIISTIFVIPGQQGIAAPGDGLSRLEKRLVESSFKKGAWSRLLRSLIPRPGLEVQIPKFSHRSVINATVALKKMGLKDLFNAETADLRGLNGVAHELYLSDMLQLNNFATCGEERKGEMHHTEMYPATASSARNARHLELFENDELIHRSDILEEPRDYQRAFHDPLHDPSYLSLPLPLRPRQARVPEAPRLRFDRPFLYFVRHNPTGLILHMGRFNPRLLP